MPTLGQISNLTHYLGQQEWLKVQFGEENELFEALERASEGQFDYIKLLYTKGKVSKLRDILINLGLKPIEPND